MMEVRGPTGIVIRFPEGTDPQTIDRVMREAVGKQQAPAQPAQPAPQGIAAITEQVFRERDAGIPQPKTETFFDRLQTLDSGVRRVARGVPILGALADRADPQPEQDAAFQRAHPVLAPALEIGGGIASLGGAAAAIPGAAAALGMRGPALVRPLAGAVTGATLSGGDAAVRGGDVGKAMMLGGGLGAAVPVAGHAVGRVVAGRANRAAQRAAPTADQRRGMASAAFKEAENAGVGIRSRSVGVFANDLATEVVKSGYRPALHPGIKDAFAALREILARGPMTLDDAHYLRRVFQAAGKDMQNVDQGRLSGIMVDKLDDYLTRLRPSDVFMGDAARGTAALKAGIDNWRIMRKSEVIEQIYERARNAVGANYTNAGMDTALRQQFRALANNQRLFSRFSADEKAAILKVVRGAPVQNAWRLLGKFAPSGLVSATLSGGVGYAIGGPLGSAALMGAGAAGKHLGARATLRNAGAVDAMVRSGGTLPGAGPGAGQGASAATTGLLQGSVIPTIPRWATTPIPQIPVKR